MSEKLILPPKYLESIEGSLIFLAGPIQGAHGWQEKAIEIIQTIDPEVYIASPRRREMAKGDFSQEMYNEQVDWETFHLRTAGKKGVVIFWLAKESEHDCSRAYAQTSRFELAEWKMRHERDGVNLVIGVEEGFSGARYIKRRFSQDCPGVPICLSVGETCREAIRLINK